MPDPSRKPRILYLQPSLVPPAKDPARDRFFLMSGELEGDVVQPIWFTTPEEVEKHLGPNSYPVFERGSFRYHFLLAGLDLGFRSRIRNFWFFITKTLEIHRQRPFECIVAYSHLSTAVVGVWLKWLTWTRLVIEIATSPHLLYTTDVPNPGWKQYLRRTLSDIMLHFTVTCSNCVHLLYPEQLDHYPLLRGAVTETFHEFVVTSHIDRQPPAEEEYILHVGAPWYLKGIDVLIEAFNQIKDEFPRLKLKIQGYLPEAPQYTPPGGFDPRVELLPAQPNEQTLARLGQAQVFVLASRCEGMGRVLIEAMASGVPVVGSDAGGIPSLAQNNVNGLVFPSGNATALAQCLRRLLSDPALRRQMGDKGYEIAHQEKDEKVYVRGFRAMVDQALGRK